MFCYNFSKRIPGDAVWRKSGTMLSFYCILQTYKIFCPQMPYCWIVKGEAMQVKTAGSWNVTTCEGPQTSFPQIREENSSHSELEKCYADACITILENLSSLKSESEGSRKQTGDFIHLLEFLGSLPIHSICHTTHLSLLV